MDIRHLFFWLRHATSLWMNLDDMWLNLTFPAGPHWKGSVFRMSKWPSSYCKDTQRKQARTASVSKHWGFSMGFHPEVLAWCRAQASSQRGSKIYRRPAETESIRSETLNCGIHDQVYPVIVNLGPLFSMLLHYMPVLRPLYVARIRFSICVDLFSGCIYPQPQTTTDSVPRHMLHTSNSLAASNVIPEDMYISTLPLFHCSSTVLIQKYVHSTLITTEEVSHLSKDCDQFTCSRFDRDWMPYVL